MTPRRFRFISPVILSLVILVLSCGLTIRAQQPAPASVEITGDVSSPMTVTATDLSAMPQVTVMAGTTAYEGVLLEDVLKRAGAVSGSSLKGKALSTYVLAEGRDGYAVVFSLGELDSAISDGQVVLAETSGGKPLADTQGPFLSRLAQRQDRCAVSSDAEQADGRAVEEGRRLRRRTLPYGNSRCFRCGVQSSSVLRATATSGNVHVPVNSVVFY